MYGHKIGTVATVAAVPSGAVSGSLWVFATVLTIGFAALSLRSLRKPQVQL